MVLSRRILLLLVAACVAVMMSVGPASAQDGEPEEPPPPPPPGSSAQALKAYEKGLEFAAAGKEKQAQHFFAQAAKKSDSGGCQISC